MRTATERQNKIVKALVDGMLDKYLQQTRTIILAVIPANVDIATVDILERASVVDPEVNRTIGVLTKPDLVGEGGEGEVIKVLRNHAKPLLHGYFMLKNRSQKDLNDKKNAEDAEVDEQSWLKSSKYADIPGVGTSRLGVKALTAALTNLLVGQIAQVLPDLSIEIQSLLQDTRKRLTCLGKRPPDSQTGCSSMVVEILDQYCSDLFRSASEGNPISEGTPTEIKGILQAEYCAREAFRKSIHDTCPAFDFQGRARIKIVKCISHSSQAHPTGKIISTPWDPAKKTGSEIAYSDTHGKYSAKVVEAIPSTRAKIS